MTEQDRKSAEDLAAAAREALMRAEVEDTGGGLYAAVISCPLGQVALSAHYDEWCAAAYLGNDWHEGEAAARHLTRSLPEAIEAAASYTFALGGVL